MYRLSLVVLFFVVINTFGQKGRLSVGLTGGYISSNVLFTRIDGQRSDAINSITEGITFQHMSSKYGGVQVGLQLANKGIYITDGKVYYKRNIDYIEIPIMTHFELGNKNLKFIINLGPQLSFAYQSIGSFRETDTLGNATASIQYLIMATNKTKTFQFGLVAGLGVAYQFKKFTIQLDGRFYNSFTNVLQPGRLSNLNNQTFGGYLTVLYNFYPKEKTAIPLKNP